MAKTNAARLLEAAGVPFELRSFDVPVGEGYARRVADQIGLPPEQVFKTLVVRGDRRGVCMAVVPAGAELDRKALAAATGDRKVDLVGVKEIRALTGYVRGGVTAIGIKRSFPVYLDESATRFDRIAVSAGSPGLQIVIGSDAYRTICEATLVALAAPSP